MSRSPESQLKRARELALKERRLRKQQKKVDRAAARLNPEAGDPEAGDPEPGDSEPGETPGAESK